MSNKTNMLSAIALAVAAFASQSASATAIFDSGVPASWSCTGSCGASGANGVVGLAPTGGTQYGWVSTNGGVNGVALPGVGGSGSATTGSILRSNLFTANVNELLNFSFNFVTSDGAGYADYAWARLLDAASNQVALLFTARTAASGSIVPGFSMPVPTVTLDPTNVPIIGGAPVWAPLGGDSGRCYSGGCGYTGWIKSSYALQAAGTFQLEFGVTNWLDNAYQTGMAIDGVTINGRDISNPVSAPTTLGLLGLGLVGVALRRRRK